MSEAPDGGHDSRSDEDQRVESSPPAPDGDAYSWYRRGLDLLSRGSAAAAAQLLQRAAEAEPGSRSVLEALGRARRWLTQPGRDGPGHGGAGHHQAGRGGPGCAGHRRVGRGGAGRDR